VARVEQVQKELGVETGSSIKSIEAQVTHKDIHRLVEVVVQDDGQNQGNVNHQNQKVAK
jgi:hypothetical protein